MSSIAHHRTPSQGAYASVNGLNLYYEIHGSGQPLLLLHGGFGLTGMFGDVLPLLMQGRQVIAVDLQGHGRTADSDRPLRLELMADDIAALITHLRLERADVMGYSMGGAVALRTAIQHPAAVRKLVVVSTPHKRAAWYPDSVAAMEQMSAAAAPFLAETPMYHAYVAVAPDPEHFAVLCDKMGDMLRRDYDWSREVAALTMPTMIVMGDADSIPPTQATEFFALLGGGQRDGSWDQSGMTIHRLAILPGATHYDIFSFPALAAAVTPFLDAPMPDSK
ncbi:MAG: Menaquinone biosynthesis related protein MenX [uncultured Chloroflexia bacterium]|uniref:Menaquinone biosynthesis related protein MenX n=1 Tax=uncultured Chloroflexia bacterium TaxID=1672391 RepID=A0A6J4H5T2_9CHLR|nr:MAG: Menaquinone biosynthesis related protein MenX [uncultured Chloroflexia bacterium]